MVRYMGYFTVGVIVASSMLTLRADAGEKSDSKVKPNVTASKIDKDGQQNVTITLEVNKDWYIYANPVGNDNFADNCTRISITAKENVKAEVVYPKGKVKTEGKTTVHIYEPTVVIVASVQRTPGDASPLVVSIEVNACRKKDGRTVECLLPGTLKVTVK